jgi:hypothetical protein
MSSPEQTDLNPAPRPALRLVPSSEALPAAPVGIELRKLFEWRVALEEANALIEERTPTELALLSAMRVAVQIAEKRIAALHREQRSLPAALTPPASESELHWLPARPARPAAALVPRSPLSDLLDRTAEWRSALAHAEAWIEAEGGAPELVLDRAMGVAAELAAGYLARQESGRRSSPPPRNTSLAAGKRGLIRAARIAPLTP